MSNRRRLNLDEARKARAEKDGGGEGPVFELAGKEYPLPASPPMATIVGFAELTSADKENRDLAGFARAVRALFGDNTDELLTAGLDVADLGDLLDLYNDEEGSGESPASGDSSSSGTRRSRPTSAASTA